MAASLGLTPDQFWGLTPYELKLYADGATEKHERDMETLAWVQANLINVHVGKGRRVRASDLFRRRTTVPEFASADEFREYMRKRQDEEG